MKDAQDSTVVSRPEVTGSPAQRRTAKVLTEALAPSVLGVLTPVLVGAGSDARWWRGALLGLVGAVFAIGVPYAFVARLLRAGRGGDHHVADRRERPRVFALTLASLAVGLGVLALLDAPAQLLVLLVAMVVLVALSLVISTRWKVSVHAAVAAGSVVAVAVVFGPWVLLAGVLVVAVAWSRVVLGDHTTAQVLAGAGLGVLVLGLLLLLF